MFKRIRDSLAYRYRLWRFRPYIATHNILDESIQFFVGDLFGEDWYGPAHDLSREYAWIKSYGIKPGDIVIDCGANHGFSTTLFARWTGSTGKVYAFEPLDHNVAILQKNLELNGISNVTLCPVAVGAQSGTVFIFNHPNASITPTPNAGRETCEVPLVTLDSTIPASETIDFLKIDVEGFELEVIKGAQRVMEGRPRLDVEVHVVYYQDKVGMLREVFDSLRLERYSVHIQPEVDGPIVSYDPNLHTFENLAKNEVVHLFCA